MEAINYANGSNMTLPADAQIVQGISGNAVYLPAGAGTMPIAGNRNELTISLWRQWDGVVDSAAYRGVFSTANIEAYFDQATDFLTIELAGVKTVTDIKDDQEQTHWCFLFSKNGFFKIYKNAELKAELTTGNYPVDFSEGFTLGGGRTHATFDEVRMYKTVVTEPEIRGLYRLVTKGMQVQQLENIVTEATPKYLGVVETVPDTKTVIITKGEKFGFVDANPGDWVLSGKTIGGWKIGVCYRWSGAQWVNLEPEVNYAKEYQACLVHLFEIEELKQQTGHFGALFAKVLVAQKALIDELLVNQAFIKNLVVQKLKIDTNDISHQDFEVDINENVGISVRNKGDTLFKVSPEGIMQLADKLFFHLIKYSEIGKLVYFNTDNESCKSVFERYGEISKNAYGKFKNDQIHKISIKKTKGENIDYYCFVHVSGKMTASGFWCKFTTQNEKYIITFFGQNNNYIYTRINTPQEIQYPPDGTVIPSHVDPLKYDEYMANKCGVDRKIYKTKGTGGYSCSATCVITLVTHGEIFTFNKVIEEQPLPKTTLYDNDPEQMSLIMELANIPKNKPAKQNVLWRDGNTLKIS
ncbi:LamG domain-containing protein [Treponema denticola]|uniref:LamG domain-containing protein n=1 Tax=Treponema denticola TaxID=158 RepID=UPI0021054A16|nr:LamG domain-containing protein [Treponema denticola]UTY25300.1 hypothetical protein E4N77_00405 [Treponema denticola]